MRYSYHHTIYSVTHYWRTDGVKPSSGSRKNVAFSFEKWPIVISTASDSDMILELFYIVYKFMVITWGVGTASQPTGVCCWTPQNNRRFFFVIDFCNEIAVQACFESIIRFQNDEYIILWISVTFVCLPILFYFGDLNFANLLLLWSTFYTLQNIFTENESDFTFLR